MSNQYLATEPRKLPKSLGSKLLGAGIPDIKGTMMYMQIRANRTGAFFIHEKLCI
jgi:hypothetical protein